MNGKIKVSSMYGQMGNIKDEIVKAIDHERLVDICMQILEFTTNVTHVVKCINIPCIDISDDITVISNSNILPERFYGMLPDDIVMVCKAIGFDNFIISFGRIVYYKRPLFNNVLDNPFTVATINLMNFTHDEIYLGHIQSTSYDMNIVDKELTMYNEHFKETLIYLLS